MRSLCFLICVATAYGQLQDCDYAGTIYHSGDSFKDSDGCNTCFCSNGAVACTLMYCAPKSSCTYGGVDYHSGAKFDALDGCNSCHCLHGTVSCTEMACFPQTIIPPL